MHKKKNLLLLFSLLMGMSVFPLRAETVVPASKEQMALSFAPVVRQVAPAVVNIYTRKTVRERVSPFFDDPFFQQFFGHGLPGGMTRQRMESALGSGVIVKPSGLIVTSNHVIAGADEITVVLSDRREFDARIVTSDEKTDLAVLKIDAKGTDLPYLEIRDSDTVEVGDLVLAVGNPFGVGQTVTSGIVSALARTNVDITDINYFIQTDAAINPGNSGGALVTMDGRLIGVNSAIFSRSGGHMGLGFAVPSNMARAVLDGAKTGQRKLVRPWTGIKSQPVTNDLASSLGLARPVGLLVNGLHEASPARRAGVRVGDVILSVEGKEIENSSAFAYRIATLAVGGRARLEIMRGGKRMAVDIDLIAPPKVPLPQETRIEEGPLAGAVIANLSPALVEEYGLPDGETGVVVLEAARGSAARIGLRKGDILLDINDTKIGSVAHVHRALEKPAPRGWHISFRRGRKVVNLIVRGQG